MRQPIRWSAGLRLAGMLCVLVVWCGVGPVTVQAQEEGTKVQRIEEVEVLFEEGVTAFQQENYDLAYRRFRRVAEYPLNQRTTAALLMAGKTLYEQGAYDEARSVLQTLVRRYPQSRYREEARRVMDYAREAQEQTREDPDPIRLGVALPLGEDATLTQAMFNGIRLAVEERNGIERRLVPVDTTYYTVADTVETAEDGEGSEPVVQMRDTMRVERTVEEARVEPARRPVQLFFRDSGDDPDRARAAVDSLINYDRVDAIIGPLYSREARAAGAEAERSRVVLIAPLATDEDIARDRRYVFQANPPIRTRGEIMAQFAIRSLLADTLGVIFERGSSFSADMAEGFREEVERQGRVLSFFEALPNPRTWSRLPEHFNADTLLSRATMRGTDSVYLPFSGRNAAGRIQDALTGLGRLQLVYGLRVRALGNSEWHNLAIEQEASKFNTIYTNDFYADQSRPEVREFVRRYRLLTGSTPDEIGVQAQRLAYTGYDVADFLLDRMAERADGSLVDRLREAPRYEGVGTRIDFRGDNVNRTMFIHRYREGRIELIR